MKYKILIAEYIVFSIITTLFFVVGRTMDGIFSLITMFFAAIPLFIEEVLEHKIHERILFLFPIIFIVNAFLMFFDLFGEIGQIDKIVHFGGGVTVAFFAYHIIKNFTWSKNLPVLVVLYMTISTALIFGVAWEVFEWAIWVFVSPGVVNMQLNDTIVDIIADTLGACVVAVYYFFKQARV